MFILIFDARTIQPCTVSTHDRRGTTSFASVDAWAYIREGSVIWGGGVLQISGSQNLGVGGIKIHNCVVFFHVYIILYQVIKCPPDFFIPQNFL